MTPVCIYTGLTPDKLPFPKAALKVRLMESSTVKYGRSVVTTCENAAVPMNRESARLSVLFISICFLAKRETQKAVNLDPVY